MHSKQKKLMDKASNILLTIEKHDIHDWNEIIYAAEVMVKAANEWRLSNSKRKVNDGS